jgi:hypothetical protein
MGRDDERTWTELVESFHASTDDAERTWPDAEDVDSATSGFDGSSDSSATSTQPGLSYPDSVERGKEAAGSANAGEHEAAPAEPSPEHSHQQPRPNDDEHFVPPTPPPIPRTDMITMMAWAGVFGTPVLFAGAYVLGQSVSGLVSMIALIAFIGGFGVLISRLRGHDPHDPDSGAVV